MRFELLEAGRVHSIVGGFFAVYNYDGYGLSERISAGALEHELRDRGHEVIREWVVDVRYKAGMWPVNDSTWSWTTELSSRTKQRKSYPRPTECS